MKIKRIKKLKIGSYIFNIEWDKSHEGAWFDWGKRQINIGIKNAEDLKIFMLLCHELMEMCAIVMNVRYSRPDCDSDYLFSYDHRQHDTMIEMFSGLLTEFIV